jgi:hypothetical protein
MDHRSRTASNHHPARDASRLVGRRAHRRLLPALVRSNCRAERSSARLRLWAGGRNHRAHGDRLRARACRDCLRRARAACDCRWLRALRIDQRRPVSGYGASGNTARPQSERRGPSPGPRRSPVREVRRLGRRSPKRGRASKGPPSLLVFPLPLLLAAHHAYRLTGDRDVGRREAHEGEGVREAVQRHTSPSDRRRPVRIRAHLRRTEWAY